MHIVIVLLCLKTCTGTYPNVWQKSLLHQHTGHALKSKYTCEVEHRFDTIHEKEKSWQIWQTLQFSAPPIVEDLILKP